MSFLQRLRKGREAGRHFAAAEAILLEAEERLGAGEAPRLLKPGAAEAVRLLERAHAAGWSDSAHLALRQAQALLLAGEPERALEPAYAAASARPYDVDSRIVHGTVRLALGQLPEAEHEFESLFEEFGREPDAVQGLLAVRLARGEPALEDDLHPAETWRRAARTLAIAWHLAGNPEARLAALRESETPSDTVKLIEQVIRSMGEG